MENAIIGNDRSVTRAGWTHPPSPAQRASAARRAEGSGRTRATPTPASILKARLPSPVSTSTGPETDPLPGDSVRGSVVSVLRVRLAVVDLGGGGRRRARRVLLPEHPLLGVPAGVAFGHATGCSPPFVNGGRKLTPVPPDVVTLSVRGAPSSVRIAGTLDTTAMGSGRCRSSQRLLFRPPGQFVDQVPSSVGTRPRSRSLSR